MPHGTACARLKKLIFFKLIIKCGEDICFQCKQKIIKVDDLSIEHKDPWENRDVALFWDLNNVGFSHLRCNIKAANRLNKGLLNKIKTHCPKKHEYNLKNTYRWPGRQNSRQCRVCLKERMRKLRKRRLRYQSG